MTTVNPPATLEAWLAYLETLHPKAIALGLDRTRAVAQRLGLQLACPVITVTGTNGKGSTCAMLDAMARAAGYRTVLYTSPHLLRYNERVRIDGEAIDDARLVGAFQAVEAARRAEPAVPLTYFEFGTLAALRLFAEFDPDLAILEVGLGGRLDAVNIVDADVAVITTVDIDHTDYLGPDRDSIGREKAGILRAGRPAICGDPAPPPALLEIAETLGAPLAVLGRDFGFVAQERQWRYWKGPHARHGLPVPALRGNYQLANAATAIAALEALGDRLPVHAGAIRDGLLQVELAGRFQVLPGRPTVVLDVAHNPHAARALAATLGTMGYHPTCLAVVGMLADKDVGGVLAAVAPRIDHWHVGPLPEPRGAAAPILRDALVSLGVAPTHITLHESIEAAFVAARDRAQPDDRIVVFGSFLTVAAVLPVARARASSLTSHG
ncbi:MAG: bifunctional tetrahydrofolate synthase/dihydrofolate synthase [Casimicrobiaceae bacterium]